MNAHLERMHRAARDHYVHGKTLADIANKLNVSRSTVSRLLKEARELGMVHVSVAFPPTTSPHGDYLAETFGINVFIAQSPDTPLAPERVTEAARTAAIILNEWLSDCPHCVVGVSWGTTVSQVMRSLIPRPESVSRIVIMDGLANYQTEASPYPGGILADAADSLGGTVINYPVPVFFDNVKTKELLWQEQSIKHVHDVHKEIDIAVFSVGSFDGPTASHMYLASNMTPTEVAELHKDGVVGDVAANLIRADGSWKDIECNERSSGIPLDQLTMPRRMCVVAAPIKAPALLAALRAGVITDLVVDETTARATCMLMDSE